MLLAYLLIGAGNPEVKYMVVIKQASTKMQRKGAKGNEREKE